MIETIILRFRDAIADTINEHTTIIHERGYVWWGWWKKVNEPDPTQEAIDEPDRVQLLVRLKNRAATSPVDIGLYDKSESNKFFVATLAGCAYATDEPIPSPEPFATPEYYREKELPAWFKLTAIMRVDEKEFRRRFAVIPVGNATLFAIWIKDAIRTLGLSSMVTDVIPADGNAILHISDLHFGEHAYPATPQIGRHPLEEIIERDLRRLGIRVGVLIASGDFTTKGDEQRLFEEALPFLRLLTTRLGLQPEHVVLVPGNHDIPLGRYDPFAYSHEERFSQFLSDFYGPRSEIVQIRRYTLPNRMRLEIVAMNSVRLRNPEYRQFGYVQWHLYDGPLEALPRSNEALRVAVLHHHLTPAPRVEIPDPNYPDAGVSVTLDAGEIIEGLQKHGFTIALHGHQHVPAVTRIARGRARDGSLRLEGLDEPLYVIAGGSTGTSRLYDEMRDNTYGIFSLDNSRVRLRVRRFNAVSPPRDCFEQELTV